MATSWNTIFQGIAHLLGAVKGATVATAETNYTSAISNSTLIGPDYTGTPIQDAVAAVLAEIIEAISENPLHPEWADFRDLTADLASGDLIPKLGAGGAPRIGRIGSVLDSSDSRSLKRASLDEVREYNRFKSTIYAQHSPYKFAIAADRIEHTRENVKIEVFCFERPTDFSNDIPIRDTHEQPLVCGGVMRLAPKESMYGDLWEKVSGTYTRHLESIRALGNPQAYTEAAAAPSNT
jgi:hypothetical protein